MNSDRHKWLSVCLSFLFSFSPLFAEPFLVILVDARHLDYSGTMPLLESLANQKSSCGIFGHTWIYLEGEDHHGRYISLEGGHSGDVGRLQPKYFDGIMKLIQRKASNPISYLWREQHDGFFEEGNGGHVPTYAIKRKLTQEQFLNILEFIHHYSYDNYALTAKQCCYFVSRVSALAGMDLKYKVTIGIDPVVYFGGTRMVLWEDPRYSTLTVGSPDMVEQSLMQAVQVGQAEPVLKEWIVQYLPPFKKALL